MCGYGHKHFNDVLQFNKQHEEPILALVMKLGDKQPLVSPVHYTGLLLGRGKAIQEWPELDISNM